MSVTVPVPVSNSAQTYGSIPPSDTPNSSITSGTWQSYFGGCPWTNRDNSVCSGKKQSILSSCSALKLCVIFSFVLLLTLLFLFVSGIMYVNLKDIINVPGVININKYNTKILNNVNIDIDECKETEYFHDSEPTYTYSDGEKIEYEFKYYCYTNETICLTCLQEFEENNECPVLTDSEEEDDPNLVEGCFGDCDGTNGLPEGDAEWIIMNWEGLELNCFYTQEEYTGGGGCYSWDSIVTKVIKDNTGNGNNGINNGIITQDVMINDIKLGDYVITGINGEYSKVIDRSHFNVYERSEEKGSLMELCFDTSKLNKEDADGLLYNCIKMTDRHLIYVNGNDLDSLDRAGNVKIGDYLFHTGLNQFVQVNQIKTGIKDYYRTVITQNGNIVINNGFLTSTITKGKSNGSAKDSHKDMVRVLNGFYKVFTLNGMYEGLWESEWFDHILRFPAKNAIEQWMGHGTLYSTKYPYPIKSMVITQSIGCLLLYIFTKAMMSLFNTNKSVSY